MNCQHNEYSIPSATGVADIYVQSFTPDTQPAGIIQIIHGMAEHTDRYVEIAKTMAEAGFAVFMSDHAGHGKSIKTEDDLGYFGDRNGSNLIVDDAFAVTQLAKQTYPDAKVILWGHSMGSFVTRSYLSKYKNAVDAAVICGTAGANPAASIGALIADMIAKVKGSHFRSTFINGLAFGAYNKKFEGRTDFDWLSVDKKNVDVYIDDPKCGYLFTATAYRDLFRLLGFVSTKQCFADTPKNIPLYLIAGDMDPVGNFGKGVTEVYEKYKAEGCNVQCKLYKGMRHEIHNEAIREEVIADILSFAKSIL